MQKKSRGAMFAALAMGLAAGVAPNVTSTAAEMARAMDQSFVNGVQAEKMAQKADRQAREAQAVRSWWTPPVFGPIRRGPGWSHAQVQRMARKRRNQARNKRAHRR